MSDQVNDTDESFMQHCLNLALNGKGKVSPNPMVGAVLVYEGKIIGEGYHAHFGGPHAEVNCIQSVSALNIPVIKDSTLYVSLEPCSHFGKTPPCVDLILQFQIKKVVIACKDSSAKVNGRGIALLRSKGVEVIEHVLEKQAIKLNTRFFTFHQKKRPYIILKWAQSLDGFIGKKETRIKLSNDETNKLVHQWRTEEDAIWIGYETARIDNPQLNVRYANGKNPIRIVFDQNLSLPTELILFNTEQSTLHYNCLKNEKIINYEKILLQGQDVLKEILEDLHGRNILSIIIEGGTKLLQQFIDARLWDEIRMITTPIQLMDGVKAPILQYHTLDHTMNETGNQIQFYTPISFPL